MVVFDWYALNTVVNEVITLTYLNGAEMSASVGSLGWLSNK